MSDLLKLDSPDPGRAALEELRRRAAAHLGVDAETLLLAATPAVFALAGQNASEAQVIGPADCPVAALSVSKRDDSAGQVEATLGMAAIRAALDALTPAALAARAGQERNRDAALSASADVLSQWPDVASALVNGAGLDIETPDAAGLARRLVAAGIAADLSGGGTVRLHCLTADQAEALRARLGVARPRAAQRRRTTKETDIAVAVDLDATGPVAVSTGIAFFDHMLEQIARHGGFALQVTATGDLDVDGHHTIEDACLALGEVLAAALGDKRGIARFGFELPMDETRAGVWIDLSGRPYAKFDGTIPGERVAGFPVEMTVHAFRSLAEAMKASIHVEVEGENAHHMIEACFKAFGRALRQAIRIEGDMLPTTKGVL